MELWRRFLGAPRSAARDMMKRLSMLADALMRVARRIKIYQKPEHLQGGGRSVWKCNCFLKKLETGSYIIRRNFLMI